MESKHKSEFCTLYFNENQNDFKIKRHSVLEELRRPDIRLTVDYPEDLIVMRNIIRNFGEDRRLSILEIIKYLDLNYSVKNINASIDSSHGRIW